MISNEDKNISAMLSLGDRMKSYEKLSDTTLDPALPFVIRLDGHRFSQYTRGFKKPFDLRLHSAMVRACCDLLNELQAKLAYTQSDEITLLFPQQQINVGGNGSSTGPTTTTDTTISTTNAVVDDVIIAENVPKAILYNGRIQKICSIAASLCSVKFNHYLLQEDFSNDKVLLSRISSGNGLAFFDARAFNVPNNNELLNSLVWRSAHDCVRNSRFLLGFTEFSAPEIHGLSTVKIVEKLQKEKNVDWNSYSNAFKFGTCIKKELFSKDGYNPVSNASIQVQRSKYVAKAFPISFTPALLTMCTSKYWNDVPEILNSETILEQNL